jgi:hypothetical protein
LPNDENENLSVMKNTIIEELRKIRDQHAAKFNYDIDAMLADLRRKEKESPEKLVSRRPRRIGKK